MQIDAPRRRHQGQNLIFVASPCGMAPVKSFPHGPRRCRMSQSGSRIFEARWQEKDRSMKHLLTGVAVVAALAISAPVWAQPGPNPGTSGLSGPRTTAPPPPSAPAPAMAPSAMAPSDTTSAMPPHHRHVRHAAHGKPSHHPSRFPNLQGNVANQLNQAELSRLQAGNFSMPPAPPPPGMAPPPSAAATRGPSVAPYSR